ncbi:MAG: hypothetical protein IPN72_14365 [Saprospiraceae bacterium]|nr:hypothetical protein [Saprospiraceae bacterium]
MIFEKMDKVESMADTTNPINAALLLPSKYAKIKAREVITKVIAIPYPLARLK